MSRPRIKPRMHELGACIRVFVLNSRMVFFCQPAADARLAVAAFGQRGGGRPRIGPRMHEYGTRAFVNSCEIRGWFFAVKLQSSLDWRNLCH